MAGSATTVVGDGEEVGTKGESGGESDPVNDEDRVERGEGGEDRQDDKDEATTCARLAREPQAV